MQDTTTSLLSSARRFFSGTLISRVTGLGREVAMAALFGTTPAVAAFWMAYRFAHLFRRLLGEEALNSAFIPHFESLRAQDPKRAIKFFWILLSKITTFLLCFTLFAEITLGSFLLFVHFSPNTIAIIRLTMIFFPALLFLTLYALNTSFLQCHQTFFLPSVAPAIVNLFWIVASLYFAHLVPEKALEKVAMVLVFAFACQWIVTLPRTIGFLKEGENVNWLNDTKERIWPLLKPALIVMIGIGATQINVALDALFARAADPEGPAILWYAIRLQQLPLALIGISLSGALLPPLTRAFQGRDYQQANYFLNLIVKKIGTYLIPVTIGSLVMGASIVNLIYGRGQFGENSIVKTTTCFWAYILGLVPMTLILCFSQIFYAQKKPKIPTYLSLFTIGTNLGLNTFFVFGLKWGTVSVAIATTISSSLNALFLTIFLKKTSLQVDISFCKNLGFSMVAGGATLILSAFVLENHTPCLILHIPFHSLAKTLGKQLEILGIEGGIFLGIYLALRKVFMRESFTLRTIAADEKHHENKTQTHADV